MEIERFNPEKSNDNQHIPENVLTMYRISGHENVAYADYLKSKKSFETKISSGEIDQEDLSSLSKIKNDILNASEDQRDSLITGALESNDIQIQRIGASMVQDVSEQQRNNAYQLMHKKIVAALNSENIQIQRIAMNMVPFAAAEMQDQLKEVVLQKIFEVFNSTDLGKQKIMAKKIFSAPERAKDDLRELVYKIIVASLDSEDIKAQRLAATMVQYAPKDKQAELSILTSSKFTLAKQKGKFNEIIESPLYFESIESANSTFSRQRFSKTGSETTLLLGEQFRNNLVIRHIEKSCFFAWKKAFESHADWSNAGFEYVPIEPIHSFTYDKHTKLVDVVSGVLDTNLEEWYAFSGSTFKEELDPQKNAIVKTLSVIGVNHGHPNDANFCLRFSRDKNGHADLNKVPKIYLIDFDQAAIA